jgi:hypothetical protein
VAANEDVELVFGELPACVLSRRLSALPLPARSTRKAVVASSVSD